MSRVGGAASGAATGATIGSVIPGIGTIAGLGIGGLLGGLFGGGGGDDQSASANASLDPLITKLRSSSDATRAQGDALSSMSSEALAPVLDYFKKLVGGDSQALLSATTPERSRVIDQYDTARKNLSEFGGRGGGSNAAQASSRFNEATDLSTITATARNNAVNSLGSIGTNLAGLGLSADQLASADLNEVISAVLGEQQLDAQKRGQNLSALSGLGEGVGSLIGLLLTHKPAAAGA